MDDVKPAEEQPKPVMVRIENGGGVAFENQIELKQAASTLIATNFAPKHLSKNGWQAVAAALLFCKQYGLPQKAMNQLAFINDRIVPYSYLYYAIAEKHKEFGQTKVYFIDENSEEIAFKNKNLKAEIWGVVVQVKRKGNDDWNEYYFTKDEAKQAGILGNNTWKKYPKDMLLHKAMKRAYSAEYPSAVEGLDTVEDRFDVYSNERDVTDSAERMNAVFNEQPTRPDNIDEKDAGGLPTSD